VFGDVASGMQGQGVRWSAEANSGGTLVKPSLVLGL